eukprot:CAMPEP_0202505368 /NCGR_PEP_ID=MMETSP1361-20130828/47104_1 /ASSEMBLY_ACC=CAM_ASM_000849 /TAXON_ID=210615 /ORGANISM="Staurosira complex sp., Strain CCMP2646" /LENGTH=87 /DNA_ID=CAMNT_0049139095 /DNA_START=3 /DNA_END=262 /DNA_ORIENTATION=+
MGRKSRHARDESDPLLGWYSNTLAATSTVRPSNALYDSGHGIDSLRNATVGENSPLKKSIRMFTPKSPDEKSSNASDRVKPKESGGG